MLNVMDKDNLQELERIYALQNKTERISLRSRILDSLLIFFLVANFASTIMMSYVTVQVYVYSREIKTIIQKRSDDLDSLYSNQQKIILNVQENKLRLDSMLKKP